MPVREIPEINRSEPRAPSIFTVLAVLILTPLFLGMTAASLRSALSEGASRSDRMAAAAFLYGASMAWHESATTESKNEFSRRMVERALATSPEGLTAPIFKEALRQLDEAEIGK